MRASVVSQVPGVRTDYPYSRATDSGRSTVLKHQPGQSAIGKDSESTTVEKKDHGVVLQGRETKD